MNAGRSEQAKAFETWAEAVDPRQLRRVDTTVLQRIGALAQQRDRIEADLAEAVAVARENDWPWSQIGLMLGVSKQAAQQRYGTRTRA